MKLTVTGSTVNSFIFDFYAQGTTDARFPKATAFTSGWTNNHTKSTFILQAPYTGTFVLAVYENVTRARCPATPR